MADITKGFDTLLALQQVAASTIVVGADKTLDDKMQVSLFIQFGKRAITAPADGVFIIIEGNSKSAADSDGHWHEIAKIKTDFLSAATEAISNSEAAGDTVIEMASTAGLAIMDKIFFDNGTAANAEWATIKSIVANVSVTLIDGLKNAQASSTAIFNKAEIFPPIVIDTKSFKRIRAVIDGSGHDQNFSIEIFMITANAIE